MSRTQNSSQAAALQTLAQAETATQRAQQRFQQGHYAEALASSHEARSLWAALGEHERECGVLNTAAFALSEVEAHTQALDLAQQSLELATRQRLAGARCRALASVGTLMGRLGDWEEAESTLLHALSLARDLHDTASINGITNMLLALLSLELDAHNGAGDQRAADLTRERLLHLARRARTMHAEMDQPFQRLVLGSNIAGALLSCGEAAASRELLVDIVQACHQQGYRVAALRAQLRLVRAQLALGERAAAQEQLASLQRQLQAEDHPQALAELLALQAALARADGDEAGASSLEARLAQVQQGREKRQTLQRNSLVSQEALRRAAGRPAGGAAPSAL